MLDVEIPDADLFGQAAAYKRINRTIASGDGLFTGNAGHYLSIGASALAVIAQGLEAARVPRSSVRRVLDYACGYGRVLRWLIAGFPEAHILGVDVDSKAVKAAGKALGVETRQLDVRLSERLDDPFHLIWVGSLLTHLPRGESLRVLQYLKDHLTGSGVLIFTTHGPLVAGRLRSRERMYNLSEAAAARVVAEYQATGYGFASYERMNDYGISIASAAHVLNMLQESGLMPVLYRERGWSAHQDAYACLPATR